MCFLFRRLRRIEEKLDWLLLDVAELLRRPQLEVFMTRNVDELLAEVEALDSLDDSVVALIDGLVAQVEEAKGDNAKLEAAVERIRASRSALAEAVKRNTEGEFQPSGM